MKHLWVWQVNSTWGAQHKQCSDGTDGHNMRRAIGHTLMDAPLLLPTTMHSVTQKEKRQCSASVHSKMSGLNNVQASQWPGSTGMDTSLAEDWWDKKQSGHTTHYHNGHIRDSGWHGSHNTLVWEMAVQMGFLPGWRDQGYIFLKLTSLFCFCNRTYTMKMWNKNSTVNDTEFAPLSMQYSCLYVV